MRQYGQIRETDNKDEFTLYIKATNEDFKTVYTEAYLFNTSKSILIHGSDQEHDEVDPKLFYGTYTGEKDALKKAQDGLKEKGWVYDADL